MKLPLSQNSQAVTDGLLLKENEVREEACVWGGMVAGASGGVGVGGLVG